MKTKAKALLFPYILGTKLPCEDVEIDVNKLYVNMYRGPIVAYEYNNKLYRLVALDGVYLVNKTIDEKKRYILDNYGVMLETRNNIIT